MSESGMETMDVSLDPTGARILIVDDTPANLDVLRQTLEAAGYRIYLVQSGKEALQIVQRAQPDLILLDVRMPDMDGFETCRQLKMQTATRDIPVLFLTLSGDTEDVVEGFHAGGVDYIIKPFNQEEVLSRVATHLKTHRLMQELALKNQALEQEIKWRNRLSTERNSLAERLSLITDQEEERWNIRGFIGKSSTIRKILQDINLLQSTSTTSVLISGESGTGKELIARAIHSDSPNASGPFVAVNCSSIPGHLTESLFFGHKRGAFTGADRDRVGYFELADSGTLFLDEIGDMSLEAQATLLRVLEDGMVRPLGATEPKPVAVRVLAATNQDLQRQIDMAAFREDLYFRLARFTVVVPPLRERKEDIPLLAEHFLHLFAGEIGVPLPVLNIESLKALQVYAFPGNVRELKNLMERALLESRGAEIQPDHLHFFKSPQIIEEHRSGPNIPTPTAEISSEKASSLPSTLPEAEEVLIKDALRTTYGNVSAAARLLGVNRHKLYRIMTRLNLRGPNR